METTTQTTSRVKLFKVGGCVRDGILGVRTKDIDFAAEAASLDALRDFMVAEGFRIFTEKPKFLTIRAKFPKGHIHSGLDADFVLCRRDSATSDGRRPDFVEAGTILDDLARRDFTVNAMAIAEDGTLLDPHNGRADLAAMTLRFVGEPAQRIREDSLRVLRALRFAITRGFTLAPETLKAIQAPEVASLLVSVSTERIREELEKAFAVNTIGILRLLAEFGLDETIFERPSLRLTPTMKK